jgi:uncharacterized membrane protein YfcA
VDPLVIAFGFGVGILIGLTGIGGGSLMTPLLVIFAGINPTVAVGTDLAYGAITKTLGGWRHLRKGTVDLGVSKWMAFGSVPGSIVGVILLDRLSISNDTLLYAVGGALIVVSAAVLLRALFFSGLDARERATVPLAARTKLTAVSIGAVLGLVLGLTSVGSGALIGPALILVFRLTPRRVVGTDVFHAAILLWAAGTAHWISGNVDFGLMGTILIGSLPGVLIGTYLVDRVPTGALRPALGCVLVGSALGVFRKAGLDVPVGAIVGVPLGIGVAALVLHRVRGEPMTAPVSEVAATSSEAAPA